MLFGLSIAVCTVFASPPPGKYSPPSSRIQRTMTLLANSTSEKPNNVRILFYGQSIVRQGYASRAIEAALRERFPHADIVVENRAIGGYTAPKLIRTAEHDLYPFYPDLLVFHVYGGEGDGTFEGIIRNVRERTTAEILTWTHHHQKGTVGNPGRKRRNEFRISIAEKYGCEIVDLAAAWETYMREHNKEPEHFLRDSVHLNVEGGKLMSDILVPAFKYHPEMKPCDDGMVKAYPAAEALESGTGPLTFEGDWKPRDDGVIGSDGLIRLVFTGNRVTLSMPPGDDEILYGTANIFLNEKPVSCWPGVYSATLPSRTPIDYRPAIKRVTLGENPVAEDWTLKVRDISEDGKEFAYDLAGSITGRDGSGTHEDVFVSNSGRIILDPADFSLSEAISIAKKPLPETFNITWKVYLTGTDSWNPAVSREKGKSRQVTLLQGVENTEHILEVRANGNGLLPVESFAVYRPPLD